MAALFCFVALGKLQRQGGLPHSALLRHRLLIAVATAVFVRIL